MGRLLPLIGLLLRAFLLVPGLGHAAYPGRNGLVAFAACPKDAPGPRNCGSEIWTVRPDGTGGRQITSFFYGTSAAQWSPDGRRLALGVLFRTSLSVSAAVFSERIVGDGPLAETYDSVTELAAGNRFDWWGPASWALDGVGYVVAHEGGLGERENRGLFVVGSDGVRRQLTDNGPTLQADGSLPDRSSGDTDPVWSPDGASSPSRAPIGRMRPA